MEERKVVEIKINRGREREGRRWRKGDGGRREIQGDRGRGR